MSTSRSSPRPSSGSRGAVRCSAGRTWPTPMSATPGDLMTEQDSTRAGALDEAAADNSPAAPAGERPSSGAFRRTDPAEPTPAANQRAGERDVDASAGVGDSEQGSAVSEQSPDQVQPTPERHRSSSDPGSSAAAAGEVPVPAVELTADDGAGATQSATHDRPVTGVHRPSAPNG